MISVEVFTWAILPSLCGELEDWRIGGRRLETGDRALVLGEGRKWAVVRDFVCEAVADRVMRLPQSKLNYF